MSYDQKVQDAFTFIVVDDGSPEPAEQYISSFRRNDCGMSLYRIEKDVPWNRGMARNLGTHVCETPWVLHVDTDHVLTAQNAANLLTTMRSLRGDVPRWFRFSRMRVGAADETRKKDKVDPKAELVEIHPHIDSYITTPKAYWKAGGYNEDFSGVLGGGSPFLKEMTRVNGEPGLLHGTRLHVHTRHSVPDSSEHTLPRDPEAFARRKREIMAKHGSLRGRGIKAALRLPWHKVF